MPHLDTPSPNRLPGRSWVIAPTDPCSPAWEAAHTGRSSCGRSDYFEMVRQNSLRATQTLPAQDGEAEGLSTSLETPSQIAPQRPPLRYATKYSGESIDSTQHSYTSLRRNALTSPRSQRLSIVEDTENENSVPFRRSSQHVVRRRGSMPSPERTVPLASPRTLRPLQLVNSMGAIPPTPATEPQTPLSQMPILAQQAPNPLPPSATDMQLSEEAKAALELIMGRRASFWQSLHIISIPTLGLAGKLLIGVGLGRIVVDHAVNNENGNDTLKWWGVMGAGSFALVYSIFAGSFHVNHFSPPAAWGLGAASLASAVLFAVGEWMTVQAQIDRNWPLFNGGTVIIGSALFFASLCNFTYFTHGELRHGFVPIPRRILTTSIVGVIVGVSQSVYTLTSATRRDGLVARDTVSSALLLLMLLVLMGNYSYGMRGFLGLRARRDLEQQTQPGGAPVMALAHSPRSPRSQISASVHQNVASSYFGSNPAR